EEDRAPGLVRRKEDERELAGLALDPDDAPVIAPAERDLLRKRTAAVPAHAFDGVRCGAEPPSGRRIRREGFQVLGDPAQALIERREVLDAAGREEKPREERRRGLEPPGHGLGDTRAGDLGSEFQPRGGLAPQRNERRAGSRESRPKRTCCG